MTEGRSDLLAALAPVTKALRRIEDRAAARAGITMWQYAILSVVAATPGLNQGEVADYLGYSRNRIIADLDLLEERALLVRRPGPDRRANILSVSARGRRVVRRVRTEIWRQEDELLAALPARQRQSFARSVQTLSSALREPNGNRP